MIDLKYNLHNYLKFQKIIMNNEVCKQNQVIAKKVKMQLVATRGEHPQKIIIIVNNEGCPLVRSWHQCLVVLKTQTIRHLDMVKPIDHQGTKKLQKVKEILESKFEYTTLGLSYEHMRIIVGRIFKTR